MTSALRLFNMAYDRAIARVGRNGWQILSRPLQRGLIADEILALLNTQDDSVSDSTVRSLLADMFAELAETFPR